MSRKAVRVRSSALRFSCKSYKKEELPTWTSGALAAVATPNAIPSINRLADAPSYAGRFSSIGEGSSNILQRGRDCSITCCLVTHCVTLGSR